MKKILNNRIEKKVKRWQKFSDWLFRIFKLRKMRKKISKLYYKEQLNRPEPITKLIIYAHVFKYDKFQIERGFKMFVERGELVSFEPYKKGDSKDAYTLVFDPENRSQSRISVEVPEEIDIEQIIIETINKNNPSEESIDAIISKPEETTTSAPSVAEIKPKSTEIKNQSEDDIEYDGKPF